MKVKAYVSLHGSKIVRKDEAQDYAMNELGIEIKPKGEHGVLTSEQSDFLAEFTDWYFSGDWIEKYVDENDC